MKKVLIINGHPKSGKTQLENYISENTNSIIYSSITPVKEYAIKYFGWDGDERNKTKEWRRFFAELKRMLVEEFDFIYIKVSEKVREFYNNPHCEILMVDSREPKEIERFKNHFQAITVFVNSDKAEIVTCNDADANVENYKYDYYIDNNGTLEELEKNAIEFINKLKSEEM